MGLRTVLFFLLIASGCATAPPDVPAVTGRVERETFPSAIVNDSYLIEVRLPPSYEADATRRYPVVYQLDGTASFGAELPIAAGFVSALEGEGAIADTIVVGVGYPYKDPADGLALDNRKGRGRDYVTVTEDGKPGGADAFLRFLREELIPHVDGKYRTEPSLRALSGHSLGGYLALYALFTSYRGAAPPFSGFIAGDPSFFEDEYRLLREEAALAATTSTLPASLWIEVARYDGAVQQLAFRVIDERLKAHYPTLDYGSEVRDTDHPGTTAASLQKGLLHLLGGAR